MDPLERELIALHKKEFKHYLKEAEFWHNQDPEKYGTENFWRCIRALVRASGGYVSGEEQMEELVLDFFKRLPVSVEKQDYPANSIANPKYFNKYFQLEETNKYGTRS